MIEKENLRFYQRFLKDYFAADVDGRTCLHVTSVNALFCMHYIHCDLSSLIHGDMSYRFNGKNVAMLKFTIQVQAYFLPHVYFISVFSRVTI